MTTRARRMLWLGLLFATLISVVGGGTAWAKKKVAEPVTVPLVNPTGADAEITVALVRYSVTRRGEKVARKPTFEVTQNVPAGASLTLTFKPRAGHYKARTTRADGTLAAVTRSVTLKSGTLAAAIEIAPQGTIDPTAPGDPQVWTIRPAPSGPLYGGDNIGMVTKVTYRNVVNGQVITVNYPFGRLTNPEALAANITATVAIPLGVYDITVYDRAGWITEGTASLNPVTYPEMTTTCRAFE